MAHSRFSGIRNAFDYAFGLNPNGPAGFEVIAGSNTAGTYTITLGTAVGETADGQAIVISTATPITIGVGSSTETVTPTAVAPGIIPNQLLVTATFAYAHGFGDVVRSGSFGLAEAVQAARAAGGGIVAVDGQWAQAGGVNATITATTGYTNVTILDARGTASGAAFSYKAASNGAVYAATTVSWV